MVECAAVEDCLLSLAAASNKQTKFKCGQEPTCSGCSGWRSSYVNVSVTNMIAFVINRCDYLKT